MSNTTAIQVPDIGDFDTVEVIEVLVKVGDVVKAEQSLITVESDKASMEIPSSHGGVVKSIDVKVGDKVKQGSVVVHVEVAAASAATAPAIVAATPAPSVVTSAAPATPPSVQAPTAAAAAVVSVPSIPAVAAEKLEVPVSTAGLHLA
jgi:pyruvate/2-oxoglutarate dehydrogenase complex dihydrolipoamide acyltransferase (E2) component